MTVAMAGDLVRWFQLLCLDGSWRDARPKALRWEIFHARDESSVVRDASSFASSTAGPRPDNCSASINESRYSPESNYRHLSDTHARPARSQCTPRVILHGRNLH